METILDLYASPYDPEYPIWCFDERPCVLHGDTIIPLPMAVGKPKREDYTYKRLGTAVVLLAYNIHTTERRLTVLPQRTRKEYAAFMRDLINDQPQTTTIRVIEDNLNTHNDGSFYKTFPAAQARALSTKIQHIYTPKHASWLNMAELEFSALSQQCLDRRIPTLERLSKECTAWVEKRNQRAEPIEWQFTTPKARQTFQRAYHDICPCNPPPESTEVWRL